LHPGVRGENQNAEFAHRDQPDRHRVRLRGTPQPKAQTAMNVDSRKNVTVASIASSAPKTPPTVDRRPVGAKLELEGNAVTTPIAG
jgi:hypothetical protein